MECRVCGNAVADGSKFCAHCGSEVLTVEEAECVLEAALNEGEEAFKEELREAGIDVDDDAEIPAVREKRKSAIDRLKSVGTNVKKGAERTAEMGRKISESTSDTIRKTKVASADAKQKYDDAVTKGKVASADAKQKYDDAVTKGKVASADAKQKYDDAVTKGKVVSADAKQKMDKAVVTGKVIGKDVAAIAKQVGADTETAVKKTRKSMEELGQVGVIITQRSLDVVRASLAAVEIVDEYLVEKDSNFEIGVFITGVAIPPYLEIEFHKRTPALNEREKDLVEALRAIGLEPYALLDHLKSTAKTETAKTESEQEILESELPTSDS